MELFELLLVFAFIVLCLIYLSLRGKEKKSKHHGHKKTSNVKNGLFENCSKKIKPYKFRHVYPFLAQQSVTGKCSIKELLHQKPYSR